MGNRAIITTQREWCRNGCGIYLHWNGGRDSVNAFLTYCRLKRYRNPSQDSDYSLARLMQVIANWFGGSLSVGIVPARCGAGDDNGVYIIGEDWRIVKHVDENYEPWKFAEQNEYDLTNFVHDINDKQPKSEQIEPRMLQSLLLDDQYPTTYEEKIVLCKPGTQILVFDSLNENYNIYEVLGYGSGIVNGHDVTGIPFYNFRHYGTKYIDPLPDTKIDEIKRNPNSYLYESTRFCFY